MKLKKSIISLLMVLVLAIGGTTGIASAKTVRHKLDTGDKWEYWTGIFRGTYNSNYYHPYKWHYSWAQNNKTGAYRRDTAAAWGTSKASVQANWFGPDGTVGCGR